MASRLASVRQRKLAVLRSRPLTVGVVGFGRFGQFVAKSFARYGHVIGTSRTDYGDIAGEIGAKFIPLSNLEAFVVEEDLDVIGGVPIRSDPESFFLLGAEGGPRLADLAHHSTQHATTRCGDPSS